MNRVVPIALLALGLLAFATLLLVIFPAIQIGRDARPPGLRPYTAQEARGRVQYIAEGCISCHSQQPRSSDQAPDDERGWGRASVAADYAFDRPHLLGTMRSGPDLLNVGARLPSASWHLTHFYQPRSIFDWSLMPAYPYMFEIKMRAVAGDVVVWVPPEYRPKAGIVVAKPEALDLVAYLLSLDRTYPAPVNGVRDDGYSRKGSPRP